MVPTGSFHDFFNLSCLGLDQGVGFREAVEFRHGGCGAGTAAVVPVVTGCLGEEENSDTEDDGPDEADAHGDAVRGRGGVAFRAVVDAVCGEDADCDEELVAPRMMIKLLAGELELVGSAIGAYETTAPRTGTGDVSDM